MSKEQRSGPSHGELAALIRSRDWSTSSLGPEPSWSPSLRTVLRLMLTSRYAMWMGWGPGLTFFYNDAYAEQTLGAKHPWALGRSASEVWAEIWSTLKPRIDHVLETGEATWDEGLRLFLERSGYPEETYHTFSYSPAPGDEEGETGGLFCVVIEETDRVIGERRLALLQQLATALAQTKSTNEVFAAVERCLTNDCHDIPFSITYLLDGDEKNASRVSQTSFDEIIATEANALVSPRTVPVDASSHWSLGNVMSKGSATVVKLDAQEPWPRGPWERPPTHALLVPISRQGQVTPAGVFVAGLNPHRPFDSGFQSFVELLVGQIGAGLANAGAYAEERQRSEALAEIDRAKTAFFSNVSHEFRTPLTLMLGPTEDALGSPDRALRGQELETVYRNELRLLKLVNALLDFARIEAGRVQASYRPTDLAALTIDLASTFRSAIERAGLGLDVACETLPEPIYVDRDMWEKIILNLLSNALKFTLEGRIGISVRWALGRAEVEVRDSGVGIAASEIPRLFERFHRIEGGRARTHEGSGIGLALVHELVRLHGGSIRVESELERGTKFVVSIPTGTAHLQADRIGAHLPISSGSAGAAYVEEALGWIPELTPVEEIPLADNTSSAARILVADDNADMRNYISRLLRAHWNVQAVADGHEALEAARQNPPDLILSDVMMPRLDGFELIRHLRSEARTATTPIILLSARAGEEATAEGLRAGADDYLVKPFSASALLVRVEAQLSAAKLREAIRKNNEGELKRLETMFRESPAAICLLRGPDLVVELANPLILELWGKSKDVIGKPFLQALPEIRGQGFHELLQEVFRTGEPRHGREAHVRLDPNRNGVLTDSYFDFVYAPLIDSEGAPDGVFVHAYEVTDKVLARQNAEELREAERAARQEAESANRLKDEFLATMSHELRTPLNAILGWTTLLQRGARDAASVDRALLTIERNAKTQARLIEDVLDVSRIISGKLRLDMRRVDTIHIANSAMDVVRPAAEAKRVNLILDVPPDEGLEMIGDPDRLQQVIWNLLSNAVKFTPSSGTVTLRIERTGGCARFTVRDTGVGLSPEHLPFVFERFRQVDSSIVRKQGGLGLGLAIVRHLVELQGGVVVAESDGLGKGSTFTVELPIRALYDSTTDSSSSLEEEASSVSLREPPKALMSLSGIRVLVVDDDEDARFLLTTALERSGAQVSSADSVPSALAFLDGHRIDVLISDVGMPDEDGFSLMRKVRLRAADRGGTVPAIALTAYTRSEDVQRALEVGFVRHLSKPADVDELARAVADLVTPSARAS